MTEKRVDISGFEGPYENACQTMLDRWLKWFETQSFGMVFPVQSDGKRKFSELYFGILSDLVSDIDPSGAMFWATVSHLAYIVKNGKEKWLHKGKDRLIDYDPEAPKHYESPEAAFEAGKVMGLRVRAEKEAKS